MRRMRKVRKIEVGEPKDLSGFVNRTAVKIMTSRAAKKLNKKKGPVKEYYNPRKDKSHLINRKPPFVVRGLTSFAHRPINVSTQTDGYPPHAPMRKVNAPRHRMQIADVILEQPKKESRKNRWKGLFQRKKRVPQISDPKRHKYRKSASTQTPAVYRGRKYLMDSMYKDSNASLDPPHLMERKFHPPGYSLRRSRFLSPYPIVFQKKRNLRTLYSDESIRSDDYSYWSSEESTSSDD